MKNRILSLSLAFLMAFMLLPLSVFAAEATVTDSQGVIYTLSDDGTYYTVSKYNRVVNDVVVPSEIDGIPVTCIDEYAFSYNELTSIKIPTSVTSIGKYAFMGCHNLETIEIPNSVTYIDTDAYYYCKGITGITVDNENPVYRSEGDCLIEIATNKLILGCENSNIPNSVVSIGEAAFQHRIINSTSVKISDSVISICEFAFADCKGLTSIELPKSVASIGDSAFSNSVSITSLSVDSANPVYHSKDNCIIETETNKLVVGCKNSIIPDYVTAIGNTAFCKCEGLTSIKIPDNVTSIGDFAFYRCVGLTGIVIPNLVNHIGKYAFSECMGLTSVVISNSVNYIGRAAFSHCSELTSIDIPDSVVSIGQNAFSYCTGLTSIVIPKSVTSMGDSVFINCDNLTDIYCEAESQPNNWYSEWLGNCKATVHWGFDAVVTEPTCEDEGYTTCTCNDCGEEYVYNYVPAKGHTEGEWTVVHETQIGAPKLEEIRCTECGEQLETRPIDARIIGDINGDNEIDKKDYAFLKRYCFGTAVLDKTQLLAADVNGDGEVDKKDYALLKRYCFGTAS